MGRKVRFQRVDGSVPFKPPRSSEPGATPPYEVFDTFPGRPDPDKVCGGTCDGVINRPAGGGGLLQF
jgi:hypothetical protein